VETVVETVTRLVREEYGNWYISEYADALDDMVHHVYFPYRDWSKETRNEFIQAVAENLYGEGYRWDG
jgi:hypothetical protein